MCAWWGGSGGGGGRSGRGGRGGRGTSGGRDIGGGRDGGSGRGSGSGRGRGANADDGGDDSGGGDRRAASKTTSKSTSSKAKPTKTTAKASTPSHSDAAKGGGGQGDKSSKAHTSSKKSGSAEPTFIKNGPVPTSDFGNVQNPASKTRGADASSTALPAAQTGTGTNPSSTSTGSSSSANTDNGSSPGQKAGIAMGIIAGILLILAIIFFFFRYRRRQALKSGQAREQSTPTDMSSSIPTSPTSEKPLVSPIPAVFAAPQRRPTEPVQQQQQQQRQQSQQHQPQQQPSNPPSRGRSLVPGTSGSGRPHGGLPALATGPGALNPRASVSSLGASSDASSAAISPASMSWPMPPQTPVQSLHGGGSGPRTVRSGAGTAASSSLGVGSTNHSAGSSRSPSPQWITFHEPATTVVRVVEHRRPARAKRIG